MTSNAPQDPDRALSLAYAPAGARPALSILWALDERLAAVVQERNRAIAAIKLAWWREALERLDEAPPPPEPLLTALAAEVLPRGVEGVTLAAIATGWDVLLDDADETDDARLVRYARARGSALFGCAARLLGRPLAAEQMAAGAVWALATAPAGWANRTASDMVAGHARVPRWTWRLRALGVLVALGRARLRAPGRRAGAPRQVARALWHGLSGF